MARSIKFYKSSTGSSPVEEFLDALPGRHAQKVVWVLQLIEDMEVVPRQYFQKMVNTDDLWEARVRSGSDIFRLLGFFDGPRLVVLSHAFQKKSQKTPRQLIKLAEQRKCDYFRRQGHE